MVVGEPRAIVACEQVVENVGKDVARQPNRRPIGCGVAPSMARVHHNTNGSAMAIPAEVREYRGQLTGMILELQANQATLDEQANRYGVFAFTGGDVPKGRWCLVAMISYLERPFATDRISTGEVKRYRHLVEAIVELGQGMAAGPRTLRCRHDIADTFSRASSAIQTLGSTLESALKKVLKEQE